MGLLNNGIIPEYTYLRVPINLVNQLPQRKNPKTESASMGGHCQEFRHTDGDTTYVTTLPNAFTANTSPYFFLKNRSGRQSHMISPLGTYCARTKNASGSLPISSPDPTHGIRCETIGALPSDTRFRFSYKIRAAMVSTTAPAARSFGLAHSV